ncbi:MAG: peptidoglycan DD-metalloendopeptidase family protein [Desulfuromonadaceae bacterium]|nr:peptidoglycan DD-metalloendopeptidase family protein [Desulfuromonadaceae bacterium]
MNLTIRKNAEQQALLIGPSIVARKLSLLLPLLHILPATLLFCLTASFATADIYRFVTIDGVETFTDAPSDKSATIIIKDRGVTATKKRSSVKKQKTHDISLDEIVQKAVSASLNPLEAEQNSFEAHLPQVGGTITSQVGMRIDPIDGMWRMHNGIDIAIPTGTQIKPVAPGVIVYSGSRTGYGNTVVVEHNNGIISLYAHNSRLLVTEGQLVTPDSTLALSGSTGRSTGPHLHFEAWQSGSNITMAFLSNSGVTLPKSALVASSQRTQRFRSETLSDGSILFTNIPSSLP